MYNVLHILTGDDGGITAVVRDYYKYIDKEKIHFDIACITENEGNDISVLRSLGATIFHLPMKSTGVKAYTQALEEILSKKRYDALHVHESETSYVALKVAKKLGIKTRIAHAHTSSPYTSYISEMRRLSGVILNYFFATTVIGCGELAGERVFGKRNMKREKAIVLPNAINLTQFIYDIHVRTCIRDELGISDKFVVGFVGRLAPEKNPVFCLKVIQKVHEINENAVLVMVGDGGEEERMRRYLQQNQMEKYVFLLGKRKDAERLYQGFDALLLPSVHEGFPLVVVEGLASGLPVLLSDNITSEFSFSERVRYLDLKKIDSWVDSLNDISKNENRAERVNEVCAEKYDIKHVVKRLEAIYME